MQNEIELKLQAPPAVLRTVFESAFVQKIRTGKVKTRRLVSTYFDTPYHTLRKSGVALRIRKTGRGFEQTVKAPVQGAAGLQTYKEWSSRVPGGSPVIGGIDDPGIRSVLTTGGRHKRLMPLFVTDIERRTCSVRFGRSDIELALDSGRIEAFNSRSEDVSELELELLEGDSPAVVELALQLSGLRDVGLGHLTKAERGYCLSRPALRPLSVKADKSGLAPGVTISEAFLAVLGGTIEHLRANEQPVAEGHPEGVHQARVAIRRLRAALWAFRRVLPNDERKAFNQEFREFQGQLSKPRDWHVFLDETVPAIRTAFPGRRAAARRLSKVAREERRRVTDNVAGLFLDPGYTNLILRFTKWVGEQGAALEASYSATPMTGFAAEILDQSHAKFLSNCKPLSRMSPGKRHALRKRGKKFRYACEFFAALWPGRRTDAWLEAIKDLQEALGVINDVSVAGQSAGAPGPGAEGSPEGALVSEWSRQRLSECLSETQPKWRKIQRREPFWRDAAWAAEKD